MIREVKRTIGANMKISMIIVFVVLPFAFPQLQVGFYGSSCPQAESIVKQVVQKRFNRDKSVTAALLRMHFHDCFVRVRCNQLVHYKCLVMNIFHR